MAISKTARQLLEPQWSLRFNLHLSFYIFNGASSNVAPFVLVVATGATFDYQQQTTWEPI